MSSTSNSPARRAASPTGGAARRGSLTGILDNDWVRFAARRAGRLLVSIWVLVTASFLMIHLIPGDPVRAALGPTAPVALVEARRDALGLNDPLLAQYGHFIKGLFTGDLGTSFSTGLPVWDVIGQRLPSTVQLALLAFVVALVIAVPLGIVMGILTRGGRRRRSELVFSSTTVVIGSIPEFLIGVGLVAFFAVKLGWLPVAGRSTPSSYVLPVLALSLGAGVSLARILRVDMLAVLQADYIRTARAKRLPAHKIYLKHAAPNALTATITLGGLLLGALVAGTVLVENVFAWPGLGTTIVSSILQKDYPLVQGIVLVYGAMVLLINTVVDVALALLDPRSTIRES